MHHLLHGRLLDALAMNPLMVLSIPILLILTLRPSWAQKPWVAWTALAVLIVYGIVRNIPAVPFTLLAPME